MTWTVRRSLISLGVAISLLAGVPACSDDVAADVAVGQGVLGEAYFFGRGVPQDYGTAVRWLRLAADQGNAVGQGVLGAAYYFGRGVVRDYIAAHTWLNLAATAGDESAPHAAR